MEAVTGYARQLADYLNEIGGYTPGDIPSPAMRRFRHEATTWLRNVENITFPSAPTPPGLPLVTGERSQIVLAHYRPAIRAMPDNARFPPNCSMPTTSSTASSAPPHP